MNDPDVEKRVFEDLDGNVWAAEFGADGYLVLVDPEGETLMTLPPEGVQRLYDLLCSY